MILQQPFAWPFGWLSQTGIGYRRIEERKGKKATARSATSWIPIEDRIYKIYCWLYFEERTENPERTHNICPPSQDFMYQAIQDLLLYYTLKREEKKKKFELRLPTKISELKSHPTSI